VIAFSCGVDESPRSEHQHEPDYCYGHSLVLSFNFLERLEHPYPTAKMNNTQAIAIVNASNSLIFGLHDGSAD